MGDDPDRDAILKRRNRFIALALSGLGTATASGCYEWHGPPGMEPTDGDRRDAGVDAGEPMPCLGAPIDDAGPPTLDATPGPCLSAPKGDAGADAGEPMPCLDFAPKDGG